MFNCYQLELIKNPNCLIGSFVVLEIQGQFKKTKFKISFQKMRNRFFIHQIQNKTY